MRIPTRLLPHQFLAPVLFLLAAPAAIPVHATAPVPAPAALASAEGPAAAPPRATGDAWVDARLDEIDRFARRHPEAFAAELERYAGVPRAYVRGLLAQPGWTAGDAWYACFLGRAVEATCRAVVRGRTRAGAEAGWEQVAAEFGADAATGAALRLALADSFRRWALPLQPDAAMNRLLRQREARQRAES